MTDNNTLDLGIVDSVKHYTSLAGQINLSELPAIIDEQVRRIDCLSQKIEVALATTEEAKAIADEAENMPVKIGHQKKALKKQQELGQKTVEALGETVEALKLSFDYERQLGEISKFLIAVAACSAVHTDRAIGRIEDAIQNRSENRPLNRVAKEHLQQIVSQMKAQGEIISRQDNMKRELRTWKIASLIISGCALLLTLLQILEIL